LVYLYFIPKPHKVTDVHILSYNMTLYFVYFHRKVPLFDKDVRSTTIIDDVDLIRRLETYVESGHFKATTHLCTFDINTK
jgi:hypothetical protein